VSITFCMAVFSFTAAFITPPKNIQTWHLNEATLIKKRILFYYLIVVLHFKKIPEEVVRICVLTTPSRNGLD